MTESSAPSNETSARPSMLRKLVESPALTGLAVAVGITAAFGAYAYVAPAKYRSSAAVTLVPPAGVELTIDPLEAKHRLLSALLAPDPAAPVRVETADGRVFELSCDGASAAAAQSACARLAREAVARLPQSFASEVKSNDPRVEAERQRNAEALVALLAEHPELTTEAKAPAQQWSEATDPVLKALRGERAALEARLPSAQVGNTDNPYSDPASIDPEVPQLRRRLAQIQKEMDARRELLQRARGPRRKAVTPELRARWQELVKGAAAPNDAERAANANALTAKLSATASLPTSPFTPNRPFLLLVGLLVGVGGGALVVAVRAVNSDRSSVIPDDADESAAIEEAFWGQPLRLAGPEMTGAAHADADDTNGGDALPTPEPVDAGDEAPADLGTSALPDLAGAGEPSAPISASDGRDAAQDDPFGLEARARAQAAGVTEIQALVREPQAREISGIELVEHQKGRSPGRTTQRLGSPIPPAPPRSESLPSFHPPGYRPPSGITDTQYSFVSAAGAYSHAPPAAHERQDIRPISTPPPPRPSSVPPVAEPISEPRRISTHPTPPRSRVTGSAAPLALVTPHAVPSGWAPDISLVPESRRALSDELYPLAVGSCFVIGVSGARGAAEDTSRVAAELALALSETAHPRILLLEGNLQRPSIHRLMRVEMPLFAGFSEQLERRIQSGNQRATWNVIACSPTLHVIAEGVMRIPELILSRQFEDAVTELRNYYDIIVIDGPLISEAAACRAVHDVVDGVVLVCPKAGPQEIAEATALFSHKRFSTVLAAG